MNVLSFMPVVPCSKNRSPEMKSLVEQRGGLAPSAFVGFFLADQNLNLFGQKTADGGTASRGQHLGFSDDLLGQAKCKILLNHNRPSRAIRVARIIRVMDFLS